MHHSYYSKLSATEQSRLTVLPPRAREAAPQLRREIAGRHPELRREVQRGDEVHVRRRAANRLRRHLAAGSGAAAPESLDDAPNILQWLTVLPTSILGEPFPLE